GKLVAMYGRASNGPGAMVIFNVSDPAMAPAMCAVAVSAGHLHHGADRRRSAKGKADPRRVQTARSAVISQGRQITAPTSRHRKGLRIRSSAPELCFRRPALSARATAIAPNARSKSETMSSAFASLAEAVEVEAECSVI